MGRRAGATMRAEASEVADYSGDAADAARKRSGHLTNSRAARTFTRRDAMRGEPACMSRVLFADYEFPDLELERSCFAAAGVEFATAQCRTEDDVIAAATGCSGSCCSTRRSPSAWSRRCRELGIVSRIGAGFDTVDTEACAKHGVWVANSPDYGVGEVATHALAMSLALIRNIVAYHRDIHAGNWHYLSSGPLRRAPT